MVDQRRLFLSLANQPDEFLSILTELYRTRFSTFPNVQIGIAHETIPQLDTHCSAVLRTFVQQRSYLKIPLKKGPTRDVQSTLAVVYR
jgi:hypothetical protein